jgi:hypothetical protein
MAKERSKHSLKSYNMAPKFDHGPMLCGIARDHGKAICGIARDHDPALCSIARDQHIFVNFLVNLKQNLKIF